MTVKALQRINELKYLQQQLQLLEMHKKALHETCKAVFPKHRMIIWVLGEKRHTCEVLEVHGEPGRTSLKVRDVETNTVYYAQLEEVLQPTMNYWQTETQK